MYFYSTLTAGSGDYARARAKSKVVDRCQGPKLQIRLVSRAYIHPDTCHKLYKSHDNNIHLVWKRRTGNFFQDVT